MIVTLKFFLMNIVRHLLFQISFYQVLTPDAGFCLFVTIVWSVFVLQIFVSRVAHCRGQMAILRNRQQIQLPQQNQQGRPLPSQVHKFLSLIQTVFTFSSSVNFRGFMGNEAIRGCKKFLGNPNVFSRFLNS